MEKRLLEELEKEMKEAAKEGSMDYIRRNPAEAIGLYCMAKLKDGIIPFTGETSEVSLEDIWQTLFNGETCPNYDVVGDKIVISHLTEEEVFKRVEEEMRNKNNMFGVGSLKEMFDKALEEAITGK